MDIFSYRYWFRIYVCSIIGFQQLSLLLSNLFMILASPIPVLFCSKGKQRDEETIHLCFPSHITPMEQEPRSHLDGDFSCLSAFFLFLPDFTTIS